MHWLGRLIKNIFAALGGIFLILVVVIFLFVNQHLTEIKTIGATYYVIEKHALYKPNSKEILTGATVGLAAALHDPYSGYLSPEEWNEVKTKIKDNLSGIGVYIGEDKFTGRVTVISTIKGGPAEAAGLKAGDILLEVDGKSVLNMGSTETSTLVRGKAGTQVQIKIFRPEKQQELDFDITRAVINLPSVTESKIVDEKQHIGYIALQQFHEHSGKEIRKALTELEQQGARKLILDLRDNGGGAFVSSLEIANIFLDKGDIVITEDGNGQKQTFSAAGGDNDWPLVVLINGNSASATEILAGALKANQRAELVGETTFGKGLVQTLFPLPDGGAVKLTTEKYYTPDGKDINQKGIVPHVEVIGTALDEDDVQLKKAIEILKNR